MTDAIQETRNPTQLGAWVRQARKTQGLTLEQVADKAGTGIRFLSEFERGKETVELGKVMAVLESLSLSLVPGRVMPALPSAAAGMERDPQDWPGRHPPGRPAAQSTFSPRPETGGDAGRFWDMLRAVLDIQEVLSGCADEPAFIGSVATRRAVERCFDVLGEAARRITPTTQFRLTGIPWRELIARRNSLVMSYEKVDAAMLFRAAQVELPALAQSLRAALAETGWR